MLDKSTRLLFGNFNCFFTMQNFEEKIYLKIRVGEDFFKSFLGELNWIIAYVLPLTFVVNSLKENSIFSLPLNM